MTILRTLVAPVNSEKWLCLEMGERVRCGDRKRSVVISKSHSLVKARAGSRLLLVEISVDDRLMPPCYGGLAVRRGETCPRCVEFVDLMHEFRRLSQHKLHTSLAREGDDLAKLHDPGWFPDFL